MSNPAEFIQACADGKVWLFCKNCNEARLFKDVEHVGTVENPTYWGSDPWWHEIRIFKCPACKEQQQSTIHYEP